MKKFYTSSLYLSIFLLYAGFLVQASNIKASSVSLSSTGKSKPSDFYSGSKARKLNTNTFLASSGTWGPVAYNSSGITPTSRHENGFVEVNGKFYLVGGRTVRNVNVFDPLSRIWSLGAASPVELHHYQAVAYNNEIYAIGAMRGSYPNETPLANIYIYNTQTNIWRTGATIPSNRRRGSAGVVVHNNKFYIVGGIQNGHRDGWVSWMDEYNPATGSWTILPDAPVARDHFMATLINGKIYAAGGRQTHYPDFAANTIARVDVYDIATKVWTSPTQLPTPRGAPGVAYINGELIIAGGEVSNSGSALKTVEGYNPATNTWETKSSLDVGRHATQMISYQGKLYLCAGSTSRGGSGQTNTMSFADYASDSNSSQTDVIRINAGGPNLQFGSELWKADQYFSGGSTFSSTMAISNTTNDVLYQSERKGNMTYNIPVPQTGQYTVDLHFAELYFSTSGSRVFNLNVESGQFALQNIDLYKDYGGKGAAAVIKASNVQVNDGFLTITLTNVVNNAKISGIAVFLQSAAATNQAPVANAGPDKTITLPTSSVQLSGSGSDPEDGSNITYTWSQVSGPTTAAFSSTTQASPTVSDLIAGTYVFGLVVKDSKQLSSPSDRVSVIVNPATGGSQQLVSFTLINASNEQEIQTLSSNTTLNLATLPSQSLNIRANTNPATVGSVLFALSGAQTRSQTETGAPYSLFGDVSGNYNTWTPAVGSYTLTGTPYSSSGGGGIAGTPLTINFTVVNQNSTNQAPVVTKPSNVSLTAGGNFSYQVLASDPEGDVLTYVATNLPDGLAINSTTGLISGTVGLPTGSFTVIITVKDQPGLTASTSFLITVTSSSSTQQVISFTLINAGNEQVIQNINLNSTLNLANMPSQSLNVRANTNPATVGSVVFALSGQLTHNRTETGAPYALFGDNNGNYNGWTPAVGSYTLKATPYSSSGGSGTSGTPLTVNFNVINQANLTSTMMSNSSSINDELQMLINNVSSDSILVYPNPVRSYLNVRLNVNNNEEWNFTLYNTLGRVVQLPSVNLAKEVKTLTFDLRPYNLTPGLYYLRMTSKLNGSKVVKLIHN